MADGDSKTAEGDLAKQIAQIKQQLEMFDQRLDNIDSIVSAAVERVMKQPATLAVTCPKCGQSIEIALVGNQRLGR